MQDMYICGVTTCSNGDGKSNLRFSGQYRFVTVIPSQKVVEVFPDLGNEDRGTKLLSNSLKL